MLISNIDEISTAHIDLHGIYLVKVRMNVVDLHACLQVMFMCQNSKAVTTVGVILIRTVGV
jgi:hypothetical protein